MTSFLRMAKNYLARERAAVAARDSDVFVALKYLPDGGLETTISMHGVPSIRAAYEDVAAVCFHNLTRLESEGNDE